MTRGTFHAIRFGKPYLFRKPIQGATKQFVATATKWTAKLFTSQIITDIHQHKRNGYQGITDTQADRILKFRRNESDNCRCQNNSNANAGYNMYTPNLSAFNYFYALSLSNLPSNRASNSSKVPSTSRLFWQINFSLTFPKGNTSS